MQLAVSRAAALAAALFVTAAAAGPLRAQERTAAPVVLDSVLVRGNVRQDVETVRAESGLDPGDTVTFRSIQEAIRRLWATGAYRDVKIFDQTADAARQTATLLIEVAEQPFVSEIEFRGLEHVGEGTVRDSVGLQSGKPLNLGKVEAAKAVTLQLLAKKGYHLRSMEHRLEEIPGREGEHRLAFEVREGTRVALAGIDFEGNAAFQDDDLRSAIDTKREGFLWLRQGNYDASKLRKDLRENLPGWYAEQGYIDFAVRGDTLVVDPETGKARLVIQVEEGPRYRISGFEVRGNARFPTEELERYYERGRRGGLLQGLGLGRRAEEVEGEPIFDRAAFERATERVSQLYRNEGYLYSRVEPVIEKTTTAAGEPAVNVAWEVREGTPAYVKRVTIAGNTFTHERVIRERILLLPGDVYNEELLIQSYQSISALGFFESPLPMPKIEPTEAGDVDLTFEVKEKQTGSVSFGTAVGGWGGVAGFLGYDQPNLFGQAKAGHLRWEFGRYSNNFEASYTDPTVRDSRVSGSFSLFSARDRFISFDEGRRRRTGASLRFGLPLPNDPWTRVFLGYSLAQTSYEQFDEDVANSIFGLPDALQSSLSAGVTRNTLNHPLFPTTGTRQEIEASFNGGFLGGDGDFQKYSLSGTWWVPVGQLGGGRPGSRPVRFALGFTAEAGAVFGDARLFPFERFYMGGVQFGRPLRGYEETTITPFGYFQRNDQRITMEQRFGDAYVRLSAEYALRLSDNLSLSAFYDAGNIWREPSEFNPTRLLRGAGVGIMLVTPFGPLGLDYAYGFDKDTPGWQLHFRLAPGM